MAKACRFTFAMLLFVKMAVVSGSGELGNWMYAVNAACEIIASNNRDCKVTCETPQQIGMLFEEWIDALRCKIDIKLEFYWFMSLVNRVAKDALIRQSHLVLF